MIKNLYIDSCELYKAHSESFVDDLIYYKNFCENKKTLELFAGYGRVSNYLYSFDIDIDCVELEAKFAKYILIPKSKIFIKNVLNFKPSMLYERIFAGYNSFCLLTNEKEVKNFFQLVSKWLVPGGLASLSYYDHKFWPNSPSYIFIFNNNKIKYNPCHDLSNASKSIGVWMDEYINLDNGEHIIHKYPLRLYKSDDEIRQLLINTDLILIDKVVNYNKENISDPGWVEYIFEKVY